MELSADAVRQPLADQGLVRDRLHGGNLSQRLDLSWVELDGDVLEPARPLASQDLPAQLLLQGQLDRTHIELAKHATSIVVLSRAVLELSSCLAHDSTLPVSLVVLSLGDAHIPSGDHPNKPALFLLEDEHEKPAGVRRAKPRVVVMSRPSEQRRDGKHLFSFLRLDPVAKCEVEQVPVVPVEARDAHPVHGPGNTLEYPSACVKIPSRTR